MKDDDRPGADAAELTAAAVLREFRHLEEKLNIRVDCVAENFNIRMTAIDKATEVFMADLKRVPTELDRAMLTRKQLTDEEFARLDTHLKGMALLKAEQFASIQKQFEERDLRSSQQTMAARDAVAAALLASREMMGEQAHNIRLTTEANQAQISDIKERITRMEGTSMGQASLRTEQQHGVSTTTGVVAMVVGVLGLILGIAVQFFKH